MADRVVRRAVLSRDGTKILVFHRPVIGHSWVAEVYDLPAPGAALPAELTTPRLRLEDFDGNGKSKDREWIVTWTADGGFLGLWFGNQNSQGTCKIHLWKADGTREKAGKDNRTIELPRLTHNYTNTRCQLIGADRVLVFGQGGWALANLKTANVEYGGGGTPAISADGKLAATSDSGTFSIRALEDGKKELVRLFDKKMPCRLAWGARQPDDRLGGFS